MRDPCGLEATASLEPRAANCQGLVVQAALQGAEGASAQHPVLFSYFLAYCAAVSSHALPRRAATALQAALQGAQEQLEAERQQARERAARQQRLQRQEGEWKRLEEQVSDLALGCLVSWTQAALRCAKRALAGRTLAAASLLGVEHWR